MYCSGLACLPASHSTPTRQNHVRDAEAKLSPEKSQQPPLPPAVIVHEPHAAPSNYGARKDRVNETRTG